MQKRSAEATKALAAAKAALIAYAVQDEERPGELPCPDVDRDGRSLGPGPEYVGGNCASRLGWFPYQTLDMPELNDDSGARLWYAVAENYRANSTVALNSETTASLNVDGVAEVVAVIIAPGAAIDAQTRPDGTVTPNAVAHRAAFLELENADATVNTYVTRAPPPPAPAVPFNDRVMIITRAELMRAVEKRVVGEVLGSLNNYRDSSDNLAFPWPVAYSNPQDPGLVEFAGSPGVVGIPPAARSEGLVPLHGLPTSSLPVSFSTGFVVHWSGLTDATLFDAPSFTRIPPNAETPTPALPTDTISDAELIDGPDDGITVGAGSCDWDPTSKTLRFNCNGQVTFTFATSFGDEYDRYLRTDTGDDFDAVNWNRTYTFSFDYIAPADKVVITAPTATTTRTRSMTKDIGVDSNGMPGTITITDNIEFINNTPQLEATRLSRSVVPSADSPATTGSVSVSGINFYLDPDTELPAWFVLNNWHHLIYYAVAVDYVGDGDRDCEVPVAPAPSTCLRLEVDGPTVVASDVGIAVLSTGAAIGAQVRGVGAVDLDQYLEDPSVGVLPFRVTDTVSYRPRGDATNNDYVRVLRRRPPEPPATTSQLLW